MRRWTWLMAGGLLFGQTTNAMADGPLYPPCTTKPSPAERDAAQGAFKAGAGSYQEGDYPKAILYWTDAYSRDCTAHPLLLNLAAAYERVGDKEKAIISIQTYLERMKNVPNRQLLEKRIANLKKQLEAEKARTASPPQTTTTPNNGTSQQQPNSSTSTTNTTPNEPVENKTATAQASVDTSSSDSGSSIAPWIVTGVGGALLVGGVVVYAMGSSNVSDAKDKCPDREGCPADVADQGNTGRTEMTLGGVGAALGVAGVAGGLVWHFMFDSPEQGDSSNSAKKTFTTAPVLGNGFAGLSVTGSF